MPLLARHATPPSNAQLLAVLDRVDELLLLLDGRGRLAWCSRAASQRLGCEPGQGAEAALAALEPASRQAALAVLAQAQPGGGRAESGTDTTLNLRLAGGPWLPFTLSRGVGNGWVLRAPLHAPAPLLPPLAAGATTELVQLLWDSPAPLMVQDEHFVLVAANRALCAALQCPPEALIGQDPLQLMAPEDHEGVLRGRSELLEARDGRRQPSTYQTERRLRDQQGQWRWFRQFPRWVSADDGRPLLLVVMQDVTSEHQARSQAEQSGHELEHWFDLSPIGMLVYDAAGLVVRSNAAFEALVGQSPVLLHEAPSDLAQLLAWEGDGPHPDLRPDAPPLEVLATVTHPPASGGSGSSGQDGRRQRLRARLRAFRSEQGALRVMAVVEDRSLEDEHDLAQLEIGALMDTAGVGVATYEASRGWVNSRSARPGAAGGDGQAPAAGLPAGLQAIGREQVEPGSREAFERLQRALRDGQRVQVRYAVQVPELGTRWLLTRVEPGELTGGRAALSVVTLDVTEQEEAHRRSEQLLRELSTILEGTTAGIGYLRGEHLLRCNRQFEVLLGLPQGLATGARLDDLLPDAPAVRELLQRALAEEGRHETEFQQRAAVAADAVAGPQPARWLALSASRALADDGQPELVVVLTDVSRLKAQQVELEALARERELMFNLSDVGLSYLRQDRIARANEALAQLTGYTVGELQHMPLSALFEDEVAHQQLLPQQQQALDSAGLWRGERRLRRRDGRLLWVQVSKRRVDDNDAGAGLICSYVDVDERRRAREAVQLQAERTRAILDSVLVGIVTVGDGGIEWMNRSARRMFGGELADFVGEPIAIVATADADHPLRATHYQRSLSDGQAETFECRLRGRDGREFWVVGNAVVTGRGDGAGGASQVTFALLDIERRREAEISIAQAQASLQRIIETAPLAIALFDAASGRVLRLNQMAAMFFGRPVEAVLGRVPDEWFAPADAAVLRADLDAARRRADGDGGHDAGHDGGLRRELSRPSRSDEPGLAETRIWDMRIITLDSAGAEPQLLLVASDVTEQRAAEQARFEAAISQREMLVKEVHHRIKNNLQGVAGLLQQTAARRPEVAPLISEAVGQVQAIAQVHGLQVGVSGPLRVKPLVEAITASVQRTFGREVQVQVEGLAPHRFALPEAESIPIALTVNELLTNAIKHSTPGPTPIVCALLFEEARLTVAIRNPGQLRAGFSLAQVPPGVSGLGLVRALLPRRSATLTLAQAGVEVEARVVLVPPSISLLEPL